MDLLRNLLDSGRSKARPGGPGKRKGAKARPKGARRTATRAPRQPRREMTAAEIVKEAELRG
jgi:hypothetical protein